jgi:hypothetical protein
MAVFAGVSAASLTAVDTETANLSRLREKLLLENQVQEESLRKELAATQAELAADPDCCRSRSRKS